MSPFSFRNTDSISSSTDRTHTADGPRNADPNAGTREAGRTWFTRATLALACCSVVGFAWACSESVSSKGEGQDAGSQDGGSQDGGGSGGATSNTDGGPTAPDAMADGPSPDPTTLSAYCEQVATGFYAWLQQCYGERNYDEDLREGYVRNVREQCLRAEGAVEAGRLRYDAVQATRCLTSFDATSCVGNYLEHPACRGVFEGTVPEDGDCYPDETVVFAIGVEACAEGYCNAGDTCPGTCVPYPARGESCDDGGRCAPGDYCDAELRCRARKQSGEACQEEPWACADGLACSAGDEPTCVPTATPEDDTCSESRPCAGPTLCVGGHCVWDVEAGDPCMIDAHCPEGTICTEDPETDERLCFAQRGQGGVCRSGGNHCQDGFVCEIPDGETTGECTPLPGAGHPCRDYLCAPGLWCALDVEPAGECQEKASEGGDCLNLGLPDGAACEDGLHCTEEGTCAPTGGAGDPCNVLDTWSCEDGLWCSVETGQCTTPADEDGACNPFWPNTCAAGLGCACDLEDRDACSGSIRDSNLTHTCKPLRPAGEDCFRFTECESRECQFDFGAPSTTPGVCLASQACLP